MKLASRIVAFSLLFLLAIPVAAQGPAPTEFIEVLTVTVKPGGAPDYEAFVKKIVAGAEKIGASGPSTVHGFMVERGGPAGTYMFVFPFNKAEELDSFVPVPQIIGRAYGEAEAGRILRSGGDAITHVESAVYRLLEGLSSNPTAFDPAKSSHVFLVRTEVEPGMTPEYERYLGRVKAAQERGENRFTTTRRVSTMGQQHVYLAASYFNKFADLDTRPTVPALLRSVYGETEGRSLNDESLKAVRKRDIMVLQFRPDLSRLPAKK